MSKKLIAAIIVAVLAFGATMAMATESRIETLGDQGLYLMDDTNIFTNPATVAYYPNMVIMHMGGNDGENQCLATDVPGGNCIQWAQTDADMYAYGGGTLKVMDMLTVGAFFARNPVNEYGDGLGLVLGDALDAGNFAAQLEFDGASTVVVGPSAGEYTDWENPFEIMAAFNAGDIKLGLSYYLANGKIHEENDIADTEYDAKSLLHSIKLGASMDMDGMKPEGWVQWSPFSIKMENGVKDELTGNKIEVGARLFYDMSDSLTIVPAVRWENVSAEVDWDDSYGNINHEYKVNTVETGASVQYTADRLLLVSSLGVLWSSAERTLENDDTGYDGSFKESSFAIPVVGMGLEYQVKEWLTMRGGMNTTAVWARTQEETDIDAVTTGSDEDTTELETEQRTSASLGMGLHLGNLTIDATIGNYVLVGEDGGNPVVNHKAGPNLFSALDAKYVF